MSITVNEALKKTTIEIKKYVDEKIENASSLKEIYNFDTHFDFPSVGDSNFLYKAYKEKKIYQWNEEYLVYELLEDEGLNGNIELIYGGKANGTN